MYGLYGFSHNIKNIYKLGAPFAGGQKVETTRDLIPPYLSFLGRLHKGLPIKRAGGQIVEDQQQARELTSAFSASRLNDLYQEKMINADQSLPAELQARARAHVKILKQLNPEIGELFELAIHSIVLRGAFANKDGHSAHGGTSNKCIGLMWLSMKPSLSSQDILEMYIHELTHTLVFLDELNYEHFDYQHITEKEYWATSAILNRLRPMDKVVHSIAVSCELLYARANFLPNNEKLSVHPASEVIRSSTLGAAESVLNHPHLGKTCKPRVIELVEHAREFVRNV
jgi:hypothetical protein